MRAWRSPAGFLADLGPTSQAVISTLLDELPDGPWRDLHEFAAIDPGGSVRERFRVAVWSLEDDLGASTHAVIDGELRNLTVVVSSSGRVRREEKAVVSGLQDLSDTAFVQEALARHREAERKAREVRVAAIPGALEDFNLGESFRRAQVLLLERVKSYGDDLSSNLLRTLAMFGRLHRSFGNEPAFSASLDAYVTACRLAAFDTVTPPTTFWPGGILARALNELQDSLPGLQRDLEAAAEGQERADARLNAIAYRAAAHQVGLALGYFRPPPL